MGSYEHGLEFDAYLEGRKAEQERIIELLEPFANAKCDEYCSYRCDCYGKFEAQKFIRLIKGVSNE
jgi:hypothetical protein